MEFANNQVVRNFLERSSAEALPLILVDGEVALAGRYPHRTEIARWAGLAKPAIEIQPAASYNRIRRHAKIGNKIPAEFANQHYATRQRPAA